MTSRFYYLLDFILCIDEITFGWTIASSGNGTMTRRIKASNEFAQPYPRDLYMYGAATGRNVPTRYRIGRTAATAEADLSPKISTR